MNYFNNKKIQPIVLEYQLLDPTTDEAKKMATTIMIEVKKIIKAVILTHRFHQREYMTFDDCMSIGIEACFKAIMTFDPLKKKKNGHTTDFFTWMSKTAKLSIHYYSLKTYQKMKVFLPLDEARNSLYIKEDTPSLWEYEFLFKQPHLLHAFRVIAQYIEDDGIHVAKNDIIKVLREDPSQFISCYNNTVLNRHYAAILMRLVFKKIKQYEQSNGVIPYDNNYEKTLERIKNAHTGIDYNKWKDEIMQKCLAQSIDN